ncbi:protein IWS1 homolog 1-like [Impatiens glandulifera]|uniref:protein IWS1 homolog 1-like n=1 Tax=Impatiens glandulifera TaxID=253017 RepID=UPI001FB0B029|nr:protein IWS1 homolog 1-like [Impatiens glandulifera]
MEDQYRDEDEESLMDFVRDYDAQLSAGGGKRKKSDNDDYGGEGSRKKEKKERFDKRERHDGDDQEVNEMWQTIIAGGDSEDDHDGKRTLDDDHDNFIVDDDGLDPPADRYGSDNEEGESDDEIAQLFKVGKKKKKHEKSAAEISMLVENVMAGLEVVAEEDVELNRQSKPAINKLRKLPLLQEVLSKKQLQAEFLDHGVLTLLKTWLEPLPDGNLPNINVREAVLKLLHDFPIDLEQFDRREQLKKSGLGKVIMFFSKSDEETASNKRLAKELVDKWSRPIFNKSTRFEDMRGTYEDERRPRPSAKKPMRRKGGSGMQSRDDDDDLDLLAEVVEGKDIVGQKSSRLITTRPPEAMSMDFVVRPQSKIDPDAIRARAKQQVVHDQRRLKMRKKLQQLKAPKKKQLQATKLSVEGRGMINYL